MAHPAHQDQQATQTEESIRRGTDALIRFCLTTWKPSLDSLIREVVVDQASTFDRLDAEGKRALRQSLDQAILQSGSELEGRLRDLVATELKRSGALGSNLNGRLDAELREIAQPVAKVLYEAGFRNEITAMGFNYEIEIDVGQAAEQAAGALDLDINQLRDVRRQIAAHEHSDRKDRVADEWDALSGQ
ncbi:hypothetical protein [Leifsonia sp. 1010]|uniref:hypothetical protein n=1 Tax=Leifsonia sp. 1010 TaxID=2817769 RepID=UPI0028599ABC|nr:hypothetical protein [Leifsonia sp. 1010]MDR6612491.1 hypothetical protein [Leifsonia sp. 1010]